MRPYWTDRFDISAVFSARRLFIFLKVKLLESNYLH